MCEDAYILIKNETITVILNNEIKANKLMKNECFDIMHIVKYYR